MTWMYGDEAARRVGYSPMGLSPRAGFALAISCDARDRTSERRRVAERTQPHSGVGETTTTLSNSPDPGGAPETSSVGLQTTRARGSSPAWEIDRPG